MGKTCRRGHHTPHRIIPAHTIPDGRLGFQGCLGLASLCVPARPSCGRGYPFLVYLADTCKPSTLPLKTTQRKKKMQAFDVALRVCEHVSKTEERGNSWRASASPTSET